MYECADLCLTVVMIHSARGTHSTVVQLSAQEESGTLKAAISVMCFSTWMDGGKDRSMDG